MLKRLLSFVCVMLTLSVATQARVVTVKKPGIDPTKEVSIPVDQLNGKKFAVTDIAGANVFHLDGWDMHPKPIADMQNDTYAYVQFELVTDADTDVPGPIYRLSLFNKNGDQYRFWAGIGHLNFQPGTASVIFALGSEPGNYGQDGKNLGIWTVTHVEGQGYAIENVARRGEYLSPASGNPIQGQTCVRLFQDFGEVDFGSVEFADIADGTYFIQNVESGAFLSNGASWGTRAVLSNVEGIPYQATTDFGTNKTNLRSGVKGWGNALRPSDGFNDQSGAWTLYPAPNGGVYLNNGSAYFTYDGSMIPQFVDTPTAGSEWKFVTEAELISNATSAAANASESNPVNMTVFLKKADFILNDPREQVWSIEKVGGDDGSGAWFANSANNEQWNAGTFSSDQTVTGLPAGKYRLTVQGYYRHGGPGAGSADAFENGTENSSKLFAGDFESPLMSVYTNSKDVKDENNGWRAESKSSRGVTYFIPDSQTDAAKCFSAGLYADNAVEFIVPDGSINLGIRREGAAVADWTVWDNFQLFYLGEYIPTEVPTAESAVADDEFSATVSVSSSEKGVKLSFIAVDEAGNEYTDPSVLVYNKEYDADGNNKLTYTVTPMSIVGGNVVKGTPITVTVNRNWAQEVSDALASLQAKFGNVFPNYDPEAEDNDKVAVNAASVIANAESEQANWGNASTASALLKAIESAMDDLNTFLMIHVSYTKGQGAAVFTVDPTHYEGTDVVYYINGNKVGAKIVQEGTFTVYPQAKDFDAQGVARYTVTVEERDADKNVIASNTAEIVLIKVIPTLPIKVKYAGDKTSATVTVTPTTEGSMVLYFFGDDDEPMGMVESADNSFVVVPAPEQFDEDGKATILVTVREYNENEEVISEGQVELELKDFNYVPTGDLYIQNVATGKYLNGANAWGTKASLVSYGQLMTIAQMPDGTYTIDSHIANNSTNHYLGDNGYVDSPEAFLDIKALGDDLFTIACGDKYLAYDVVDGQQQANFVATEVTTASQWRFVTRDNIIASLAKATVSKPVKATSLIYDSNFSRNNQYFDKWVASQGTAPGKGGDNTNTNAEKWGGNSQEFDVSQTITGLPNGTYKLRVQGFYRYNNTTDNTNDIAASTHANGTEVINSVFYANYTRKAFKSIADEASVELNGGTMPLFQAEASAAFAKGAYKNELSVVVTDGTLKIGVKKANHEGCDWTVWDNFELIYVGDENILVNGDAQGEYGDPACAWGKENQGNPHPADIESIDGTEAFVVHATAKASDPWDNQFWIMAPHTYAEGETFTISFIYKASKDGASIGTQAHAGAGDYLHWACIGNVNFTTEWQQFYAVVNVSADMAGKDGKLNTMQSIAFNLNDFADANDYYIDQIVWMEGSQPKPTVVFPGEEEPEDEPDDPNQGGDDPQVPDTPQAENLLVNGDAEGEYGDPACAWGKEDNGTPHPADIEAAAGNKAFVVHATEKVADPWDNQFWIMAPKTFSTGDKFTISFIYRATTEGASVATQAHKAAGDYLHWACLGNVNFTTEWQQFYKVVEVTSEMNGMQSIAFNLNDFAPANDYYFDQIVWMEGEQEKPEVTFPAIPSANPLGYEVSLAADQLDGKTFIVTDEAKENVFALGNGNTWDMGPKACADVLDNEDEFYYVKFEKVDAGVEGNIYTLRLYNAKGNSYRAWWDESGYLNFQPGTASVIFALGCEAPQWGQDFQNGGIWNVQYEAGKGYLLENVGRPGEYLSPASANPIAEKAYVHLFSKEEPGTPDAINGVVAPIKAAGIYTITGAKVESLQKGINIIIDENGAAKKIFIK